MVIRPCYEPVMRKPVVLKLSIVPRGIRWPAVLGCGFIICLLSFDGSAQGQRRHPNKDRLPRVGTIKDYPATGLMAGCANLYFYPAVHAGASGADYVFLARGDGNIAWMNLGGRAVRLQQIRSLTREGTKMRRYHYRWGNLRVSVVIQDFKPENVPVAEGDPMLKMKITLRKGRAVRIVHALGGADC